MSSADPNRSPALSLCSGPEASYGLLGKDLDLFSEAGFDMSKIHLKVTTLPYLTLVAPNPLTC